jgi:hypothetical protein
VIGWEDTVASFGRPQSIINSDLDRCELFIGVIWKRWGTPPDTQGPYTSGFEEELDRAINNYRHNKKPAISLFFKTIDSDSLKDPGPQLKRVISFRDEIIVKKELYFDDFTGASDFEGKFRRCVTRYVQSLVSHDSQSSGDAGTRSAHSSDHDSLVSALSVESGGHSTDSAVFITSILSKNATSISLNDLTDIDIARLRLISVISGTESNDEYHLGVRDANLLFVARRTLSFGTDELIGLIDSGLFHFDWKSTPLWHWMRCYDPASTSLLITLSVVGTSAQRSGALKAMRFIGERLPNDRDKYLSIWLSKDSSDDVKLSALIYLSEFGIEKDIATIKQEFERGDYRTTFLAIEAILRINLRMSRNKAISSLIELQPQTIKSILLKEIFDKGVAIDETLLTQCLSHRSAEVRRTAAVLLDKRGAIDSDTAMRLTSDSDADVRFVALNKLASDGRTYSDDEARNIILKPLEGVGLGMLARNNNSGEIQFKRW